ncbi:MAG: DASS family sodium-coupled anion symporter [Bacteroidetes bacterium]|nr:DASS family sodium-coupled anion symporter [Bacteroidota bacterium]
MADSRRASVRHLRMERVVETQQRIIYFLLSILVALGLTWFLGEPDFTAPMNYVMFLLFFSIGLWISEAIPPFAVGIMIVGFLVFALGREDMSADHIQVEKFVNTWSNSVIWLLLGGFFLAEGMKKTGLDKDVFRLSVLKYDNKPRAILLRIMLATAVASMVMSNTATTAMMIASMMPLLAGLDNDSPFAKSLLIGIPSAAAIGGMGTIIGSPPNAIAVDTINRMDNLPFQIGFLEWMAFGVPIAIILTLAFWGVLIKRFVPKMDTLDLSALKVEQEVNPVELRELKLRKRIVLVVLGLTILLWLTEKVHHIPAAAVSGIPIIALTMVSIVSGDDVRKLPWDTLMLVAGGLSLGLAIEETGLAAHFVEKLGEVQMGYWFLVIVFAMATVIFSNIMSNTATATILIPMAALWGGPNPLVLPMVIGLCASCALFLPVSTPPNAIAFSTGRIKQVDFRLGGLFVGLTGPALIILWVALVAGLLY